MDFKVGDRVIFKLTWDPSSMSLVREIDRYEIIQVNDIPDTFKYMIRQINLENPYLHKDSIWVRKGDVEIDKQYHRDQVIQQLGL